MSIRRSHLGALAGILALIAALLAWGAVIGSAPVGAAGPSSPDVPYSPDPNAVGAIRLYDAAGNPKNSGTLDDLPFADYAVADGTGTHAGDSKATLYVYTPVQGQTPAQWTGNNQLSGSTSYPNRATPAPISGPNATSNVTAEDIPLRFAVEDIPNVSTSYAGLYQLRMITNFPAVPDPTFYYAADIKVVGDTWTLVNPAPTTPQPTPTATTLTASPATGATTATSVSLSATVSPAAAGTIQFKDGAADLGAAQAIAAGGTATISTSFATSGSKSVSAIFTPAAATAFSGSTGTLVYQIADPPAGPLDTTVAVAASPQTGGPANSPVALTATVTPPAAAGAVQFRDGDVPIGAPVQVVAGKAMLSQLFEQGDHQVGASFAPLDASAFTASNSVSITVTTVAPATESATALSVAPPAGATTTTPITLSASVTPVDATGSVRFRDGDTDLGPAVPLSSGTATMTRTFAVPGAHVLSAVFTPAVLSEYTSSASDAVSYTVAATATSIALSANPLTGVAGSAVSLQATVTPEAAAGAVQFKDAGADVGSPVTVTGGSAVLSYRSFGTGAHTITAVFAPAGAVYTGSTSEAVTVTMSAPPSSTTTTLTATPAAGADVTTPVTLTAAVLAAGSDNGAVAGAVQFMDGSVGIGGPVAVGATGLAATTTTFAAAGVHSLSAVFTPSDPADFATSSGALPYVVSAQSTATTLDLVPTAVTSTTSTTLIAAVAPAEAAGSVQFKDGDALLGSPVPVVGGEAVLAGTAFVIGSHSLTAAFAPADAATYAPSTSAVLDIAVGCGPTPTAGLDARDATGAVLALGPTLEPGDIVCLSAGVFAAGATVAVDLDGAVMTPSPIADSSGTAAYQFVVPAGLEAGDHALTFTGAPGADTGIQSQAAIEPQAELAVVTFEFAVAPAPSTTPPVSSPPVTPPSTTAPPSSMTPATSPGAISPAGSAPAVDTLARTGSQVRSLGLWGLLLVALGALGLVAERGRGSVARGAHR